MLPVGPSASRVSLAGRVIDAVTERPLAGVTVVVVGSPRRTSTAPDGTFRFVGLPDGDLVIHVSLPSAGLRYGVAQKSVSLPSPELLQVKLCPTGVSGLVSCAASAEQAMYPLVRLTGSGEDAYGDAEGNFRLLAIEPGHRTLIVTLPGCEARYVDATIAQGEVPDLGTIEITVRPESS